MEIFQIIHGHWRWILALTALLLMGKYTLALVKHSPFTALDQNIGQAFAAAMTVQFVLGLIVLINKMVSGGFNSRFHLEHAFTGMMAVALAHSLPMFKRSSATMKFLMGLILAILSIATAIYNVAFIRGNWFYN